MSSNVMMVIMILSTTIKWNIFCDTPRKVIPAVRVNGFNLAQGYPEPEGDNVARNHGRPKKGGNPEDQDLGPVGIGRGESNGRMVLVVDAVNLLVPPIVVQKPVDPVIGVILYEKVHQKLREDLPPRR